ncbi:hypothetical protein B7463_g6382, partial [Scytalidium lignicola]
MPSKLDAPVLTVDVGLIHKVDTRNVENLFSMWTVFSRCAGSLEEGRRLENLSWRLWNRETFCCEPAPEEANATTPAISISRPTETQDIPELSGSLESVADEEFDADEASTSTSAALDICRPQVRRQDSMNHSQSRSRGRERHITPDDLEKMVITIKEKKDLEPISIKNHSYLAPLNDAPQPEEVSPVSPSPSTTTITTTVTTTTTTTTTDNKISSQSSSQSSVDSASSESQASTRSTTSVVRGFSPAQISSSYRSIPLLTAPSSIPSDDLAKAPTSKKQPTFALGGSSGEDSYSEQTNSMESNLQPAQPKKRTMFSFGGASSNEEESSLPQRMHPQSQLTEALKKPTKHAKASFKDEVTTRTIQEEQASSDDVFETDEDDEVDESAIDDDDDSSEWEDSVEESGRSSIDDKTFFQRVDSQVHLPSRRSLLTTMLHQSDRKNALAAAAGASRSTPALRRSRNSSPHGPSVAASPDSDDNGLMMKKGLKSIAENGRAQPMAINTRSISSHQLALSPRTTRRNMLATELTVSLRQHLLWERKQKSQTANAVLKRRHTAHDLANLKQHPDKVHMSEDKELNNSWNEYFNNGGMGEYHSKGW